VLSFIVGAGTVLSVIGTHLYAVRPRELPRSWHAKSGGLTRSGKGNFKVYLRRIPLTGA
jgi:hypothetical protein